MFMVIVIAIMVCMDEKQLKDKAHEASELMERGRMLLVAAIREAYQEGMSQRQIAAAIGKSQPEVNRLIRFHGSTPHAVSLRRARKQVVDILESEGLSAPPGIWFNSQRPRQ